ncbi:MAG: type I restriction enzyme HsdR N-terminal domain-containing protein [Bacteroidota bacterium]
MPKTEPLDLRLDRFVDRLTVRMENNQRMIRCLLRRKWLVLQPEEFVRQLLLHFFIEDMQYNRNRITVERGLQVDSQEKRTDILVFDRRMRPWLLLECKAPKQKLSDQTFQQASTYNNPLQAPYMMISNGRQSFVCELDYEKGEYAFLMAPPEYPDS